MREFPNDSKAASQATMLLVEDSFADRGMPGKVDIVMGSFSKTFGSNGGFVQA